MDSAPSFVDLDGDGDLVSGQLEGSLLAWRNTGTAAAPVFSDRPGNQLVSLNIMLDSAPTFVDLDGDGDLDLVSENSDGDLKAWRNTGPLPTITVTVTAENEAPTVTSVGTAGFAENGTGVVYQATGSSDPGGIALSWTLDGSDAGLFNINAATGAVTFKTAPNLEAPADVGGNNVYDITVTASDGARISVARAVAITVTNVTEAPSVTSAGTASFAENSTSVAYQAAGSDPDVGTTLNWTLDGTDAGLFNINAASGAVTFKAAPNFEAPADVGANSVYDITVTTSDGTLSSAARTVAITVTNVNEAPSVTSAGTASFAENGTGIAYQGAGSDPDAGTTLTWLLDGADATLFSMDAATGAVTFKAVPDFDAPADAGANNVYDITVSASDRTLSTGRAGCHHSHGSERGAERHLG